MRASHFDNAVVQLSIGDDSDSPWLAGGDEVGITKVVKLPNFLSHTDKLDLEKKNLQDFIKTQLGKINDFNNSRSKKTKTKKVLEVEEVQKKEDNEIEFFIFSKGVKDFKNEFQMQLDVIEKEILKSG